MRHGEACGRRRRAYVCPRSCFCRWVGLASRELVWRPGWQNRIADEKAELLDKDRAVAPGAGGEQSQRCLTAALADLEAGWEAALADGHMMKDLQSQRCLTAALADLEAGWEAALADGHMMKDLRFNKPKHAARWQHEAHSREQCGGGRADAEPQHLELDTFQLDHDSILERAGCVTGGDGAAALDTF